MKERDRKRFQEIIAEERARGKDIMKAVETAYLWLLQPSKKVWPVVR
jgi:hypothetical protein